MKLFFENSLKTESLGKRLFILSEMCKNEAIQFFESGYCNNFFEKDLFSNEIENMYFYLFI